MTVVGLFQQASLRRQHPQDHPAKYRAVPRPGHPLTNPQIAKLQVGAPHPR
jgi:hypothetical protein